MEYKWLAIARRIQAIAQIGLKFTEGKYDLERYEELRKISLEMLSAYSDEADIPRLQKLFAFEEGYQTPKVDVRGVVFKEGKILMIKEDQDGKWSLPGGWADINYSPRQVVAKEVWEEAGLEVKPVKLVAVFDKDHHAHPPDPYHAYKLFIHCEITGGTPKTGMETLDVGFFEEGNLPELSTGRVTENQIKMMFDYLRNPQQETIFD